MPASGPAIRKRDVDGVLLLDKPSGLSSNAALQVAKRLFLARKAGHTGTLDPFAEGLLPICFGEASKFSGRLLDADKGYRATLRLGERTDTGDGEGKVLETRPVQVSESLVFDVLSRFRGELRQIPPMYSALKRNGRPLYAYARAGEEVERDPRVVVIHRLDLVRLDPSKLQIEVECSKGTYIRVLAEDIGAALGCGARLEALRRTRVGPFTLDKAVSLDELGRLAEPDRDGWLLPPDCLVQGYPAVQLSPAEEGLVEAGRAVPYLGSATGAVRLYGSRQRFLGLGEAGGDGSLRPRRLLRRPASRCAIPD